MSTTASDDICKPLKFMDFLDYVEEQKSINTKIIHIDLTGDFITGYVLSQIVRWYSPLLKDTFVRRNGKLWIPMKLGNWWTKYRITENRARRCLEELKDMELIETKVFIFNEVPVMHIWLDTDEYLDQLFKLKTKHFAPSF